MLDKLLTMDISAESLHKKSNVPAINDEVSEIFKSVRSHILRAHQMGLSSTTFDLPNTFTVGNLEPLDIQLLIYSKIIERIEAEGLTVSIEMDKKSETSSLEISWPSQLDPAEKARMKRVILSHIKKK